MLKKISALVGGILLVGIFLAWMLLKGTPDVQERIGDDLVLGYLLLGLSWLALFSGVALLALWLWSGRRKDVEAGS